MKQKLITDIAYKTGEYKDGIHSHNGYEIIFIARGEISLTVDGETMTASEGTMIFISNLEKHTIRVTRAPYERYFMNLSPVKCDKLIGDTDLIALLRCRPVGFTHTIPFGGEAERMRMLWDALLAEKGHDDHYTEEAELYYLKLLLIMAKRRLPEDAFASAGQLKNLLHELQDYLDSHFTEDIRIGELCEGYYTNHFYLTHSFKTYTGYSPKQYLTLLRLNHAISLFVANDETVTAAALASGFSNINNFIRCFKSTFGMTPTEYKKRHTDE